MRTSGEVMRVDAGRSVVGTRYWQASVALAIASLVLIALSGVPHATSDLACDAGTCRSWSLPSDAPGTLISTAHRITALVAGLFAIVLLACAAPRIRAQRYLAPLTVATLALIIVQGVVVAGAWDGSASDASVAVHFGATILLFTIAVATAAAPWFNRVRLVVAATPDTVGRLSVSRTPRLARASALVVFAVLLTGAVSGEHGSAPTCAGWPLCGDGLSELRSGTVDIHLAHRLLVLTAAALLASLSVVIVSSAEARAALLVPLAGTLAGFAFNVIAGAATNWSEAPRALGGAHFASAGIAWGFLSVLVISVEVARAQTRAQPASLWGQLNARDYVRVTKPGIMLLLLTTTLGAMLLAGHSWPSVGLVVATLVGGALASGGASALNCYLDRDIDGVMARTRKRPIPIGRLQPRQVLRFGLLLSALAVVELWLLANPLAALLALSGNVFYVLIYTRWLKRATPQNIVIGGAAGAFPPLVGWAAVAGRVDVAALVLFAIIFYWTPPHFWSLALLKANDYRRAGIPMLPVTHGEQATRRHILLYSLLLVGITLLMAPTGVVGPLYVVAALVLGGVFVGLAARMYREGTSRLAWRLFTYSNYYLAVLLAVMVVDHAFLG